MEKCDICGERVDWDNPNIHYGGHTCDTERLDKIGATKRYVKSIEEPYNSHKNDSLEIYEIPPDSIFTTGRTPHKCPICNGRGIVPGGFYNSTSDTWTSSTTSEPCRQCGGSGIIWG